MSNFTSKGMTEADLVKRLRAVGESHGTSSQAASKAQNPQGASKSQQLPERSESHRSQVDGSDDEREKRKAEKRKRSSKKSKKAGTNLGVLFPCIAPCHAHNSA